MTRESEPSIGHASSISSAIPAAFVSAISMTTTSASSLLATARATVAPTFPAPPTTVTFRFMPCPASEWLVHPCGRLSRAHYLHEFELLSLKTEHLHAEHLHARDDPIGEFGGLDFPRAFHQSGEVVRHLPVRNSSVHPLHDEIGRLWPSQMPQHHLARENHRTRIDLVLIGVLGSGAVRGLEDRVAGDVVDVPPRCDADAANLGGQGIRQVVPVEIRRRDNVELVGPRQHLLKRDV